MKHNFLFDLDMTLLDFHATEKKALEIVVRANGLEYSEATYTHFKAYNKSLWQKLEKGDITRLRLFSMRFSDVISRCGGDLTKMDPLEINSEFINTMAQNGIPMDGAIPFLQRLRSEMPDAGLYIVSNGATVNAEGRVKSTGMDRYIDRMFISEELGVTKPAVEFFDICLSEIGATKESCIVIGDSLSSDMLGAKNAGLKSVWFMPEGDIENAVKEYDIDYTASTFDELFGILKEWAR